MSMKNTIKDLNDFDSISLKVASPERILEWSYGEVTKPETMNYRTQRSEKNGLFDEKIFGPDKDYECYCGKYRGIRYKGILCEKCGVEITRSIVRRERMGHIGLATPVAHIWFLRSMPSRLGLILGMSGGDLEKVVYFAGYLITEVFEDERTRFLADLDSEYKSKVKSLQDEKTKDAIKDLLLETRKEIESIQQGVVLDEVQYHKYSLKYGTLFDASIGAEALYRICKSLNLAELLGNLEASVDKSTAGERDKLNKRIGLIKSMLSSGVRPEWMFLTQLPVIPAGLRPMVTLEGGRHATSDVNDLYRRVINRNNRLKKLIEIHAPDVILRNEKRILQEAVDALVDNSMRQGAAATAGANPLQRRPLKSLADNLKGKRGLFRGNLLGKRVDYSGRSVIVVGPTLALDQCGLPKHMALELFKPFVISGLLQRELAFNIRGATRLIEDSVPEVWEILEEAIQGKYVLLNRAPTLHRLGIQAFRPTLIEGDAIQVHPLVCTAFNADFDGDQMAVHVPLSEEAQLEAREVMAADKNVLKPGNGDPTVVAKLLDIVLGCFWMTKTLVGEKGEGKIFASPNEAITALDFGVVSPRAKIKVLGTDESRYAKFEGRPFETSVGRLLFNTVLPEDYPFINDELDKKRMGVLVDDMISIYGVNKIAIILDRIKHFGFTYATYAGITWGIDDVVDPEEKQEIIANAKKEAGTIVEQYSEGLLSNEERFRKVIEIWQEAKAKIESVMEKAFKVHGPVYDMVKSGARGSLGNITQMAGIKGLIQNTAGETIEFPILSAYKGGLTPIEYFITTHGARKGMTDTALNTAKAGYLTRKLFSVAQDVTISSKDCNTKEFVVISADSDSGIAIPISKKIRGRIIAEAVKDVSGKTLFEKGHLISKLDAKAIEDAGVKDVHVRSPLTCKMHQGICSMCYGLDLGKNKLVDLGEAVGTVAAQAIGEPGTQLTMRTFHAGGVAAVGGDITSGLPRVEEVFEKRMPKNPAVVSKTAGEVTEVKTHGKEKIIKILSDVGDKSLKAKDAEIEYSFHFKRTPLVRVGDRVEKGQIITDGSASIDDVFKYGGKEKAQNYIITEVNKLYELQGETVSRKHIEVIVHQMFSPLKIKNAGDTLFSVGDMITKGDLERVNARLRADDKEVASGEPAVLGITEVSLSRRSFLSAASFQHTNRVLIQAAVRGSIEELSGLKENVIIGRLIPAGTGFEGSEKHKMIKTLQDSLKPFENNWEETERS